MAAQQIDSPASVATWAPYCGVAPTPAELALRWNLDPVLLGLFAAGAVLYAARRRYAAPDAPWLVAAGVATLGVAFISPLCALASALFAARVVHHALLVAVAAPLRVFGLRLKAPALLAATGLHAALFWTWHAPGPYAFALSHDAAYWTMQASLFGSALLFWAAVRRSGGLPAAGALLFTLMQTGLLGALITFAPSPAYAPHLTTTLAWGLTPLADQQLGGLIMWAPMAAAYLLAALILVGRSLGPARASAAA